MSLRLVVSHPQSTESAFPFLEPNGFRRRRTRRRLTPVGACGVCGVTFAGTTKRAPDVRHVLGVHESICPGGRRTGEVVTPFAD
jgi:hypothetical protein